MPSTLKRPSLCRLLASLRPSRESSFQVQTGFPTSLADLVVKNHGRLRKPRKPRRPDALVPPPSTAPVPLTVEVTDELTPRPSPAWPLSPLAVRRLDAAPRGGVAVFRLRPELMAVGGAVALALLAVWSEGTVAAFTVAALSLLWIESASHRRRRWHPAEAEALPDSCVAPNLEVEEAPRSSCSDSDRGSEAPSPRTSERRELFAVRSGGEDPTTPKLKAKRSLRKLISKKLQKKREPKDSSDSSWSFERPVAAADPALKTESSVPFSIEQTPSDSSIKWSSSSSSESAVEGRGGVKFPLAALAPVILAGLAVGKLPATVLAVLCIVFSSAVQRL